MEAGAGELIPRVTLRCLIEDLDLPTESVDLTMDELASADEVIAAFRERRAEMGSIGQEPIRSLLPEVVAYSLHVGRRRGATWHHREAGVTWLLAVGYHREGHADERAVEAVGPGEQPREVRDAGRPAPGDPGEIVLDEAVPQVRGIDEQDRGDDRREGQRAARPRARQAVPFRD